MKFKPFDGDKLIDADGQVWRPMTIADRGTGRDSVALYDPDAFDIRWYVKFRYGD